MADKNIRSAYIYENVNNSKELVLPRTAALAVFMNDGTSVENKISSLVTNINNINDTINNLDIDIPQATNTVAGIMKLYTEKNLNTDGTMTQLAITLAIDDVYNSSIRYDSSTYYLTHRVNASNGVQANNNANINNIRTNILLVKSLIDNDEDNNIELCSNLIPNSSADGDIGLPTRPFNNMYSRYMYANTIESLGSGINNYITIPNKVIIDRIYSARSSSSQDSEGNIHSESTENHVKILFNDSQSINSRYDAGIIRGTSYTVIKNDDITNTTDEVENWRITVEGNATFNKIYSKDSIYIINENSESEELSEYIGRIVQSASSGEISYSTATSTTAGITKLYNNINTATDGAITPNAVRQYIGEFYDGEDIIVPDDLYVNWIYSVDGTPNIKIMSNLYINTYSYITAAEKYPIHFNRPIDISELDTDDYPYEIRGYTLRLYANGGKMLLSTSDSGIELSSAEEITLRPYSVLDVYGDIVPGIANNNYSLGERNYPWCDTFTNKLTLYNSSSTNFKRGTFVFEGLSRNNDPTDLWELSLKWKPINTITSVNWISSGTPDPEVELLSIIPTQQNGGTSASDYGYNNRTNITNGSINSKLPIYISSKRVLTVEDMPSITKTGSCYIGYSTENDFTYNLNPNKSIIDKSTEFKNAVTDALTKYNEIVIVTGYYYLQESIEITTPNKVIRGLGYNTSISVPIGVPAFKITGTVGNAGGQGSIIENLSICKCFNTTTYNNIKNKTTGKPNTYLDTSRVAIYIERNACKIINVNFISIYTDLAPFNSSSTWTTGTTDTSIPLQWTGGNNGDNCNYDTGTSSSPVYFVGDSDANSSYSSYGSWSSIFINTIKNSDGTYTQCNITVDRCLFQDAYTVFDVLKNIWKSNGNNTTLVIGCTVGNGKKFRTANVKVSGCAGNDNKILSIKDNTSYNGYSSNTQQIPTGYTNGGLAYIDNTLKI